MRVAVVFGTYPPDRNGGADFVARFAEALAGRDAEVHVLTSAGRGPEREEVSEGVTVHPTNGRCRKTDGGRFGGRTSCCGARVSTSSTSSFRTPFCRDATSFRRRSACAGCRS
jgi:hypothetical protein